MSPRALIHNLRVVETYFDTIKVPIKGTVQDLRISSSCTLILMEILFLLTKSKYLRKKKNKYIRTKWTGFIRQRDVLSQSPGG